MPSNSANISIASTQLIQSFAPVCDASARTLILGSIPGARSLQLDQYYAHPQNAFWRIILELTQADCACTYEKKLQFLKCNRIALWDVLHSCERPGSLDNSILETSVQANDFQGLFTDFPGIKRVFFNGAYAESAYRKHVLPKLNSSFKELPLFRLPSTSPAHANLSFPEKLEAWRLAIGG